VCGADFGFAYLSFHISDQKGGGKGGGRGGPNMKAEAEVLTSTHMPMGVYGG